MVMSPEGVWIYGLQDNKSSKIMFIEELEDLSLCKSKIREFLRLDQRD